MGSVRFETRGDVIWIRFEGALADDQIDDYIARLDETIARGRKHALVFDALAATSPSTKLRKSQADWIGRNATTLARLHRGAAFVIDSLPIRAALTAIMWFQPLPMPHVVVKTLDEAEAWVHRQIKE
jgi:hypothetical protein